MGAGERGDVISKDVPITSPIFINGSIMSRPRSSQRYRKLALQRACVCKGSCRRVVFTQQVGSMRSEARLIICINYGLYFWKSPFY